MSHLPSNVSFALFAFALTVAGCGAGDIGSECGTPGSVADCADNAICSERNACPAGEPDCGVAGRCRQLCSDDTDCPDRGSCEDVAGGGAKSCIPPR